MDWIDGTDSAAAAFDFTTKAILQVHVTGMLSVFSW